MLGLNKRRLTSSSWSLLSLASVRILRPSEIKFLAVHQSHPWMMCLLASSVSPPHRLCHLIALQILLCLFFTLTFGEDTVVIEVEDNVLSAPIAISLATLVIVVISWMDDLPALPTWPSLLFLILSRPKLRAPPYLRVFPPLTVSMLTILGFQYFVTFIDDYSRCTWLFLMKNRVELYSIFQKFYAEILTQFNISIRVLRGDNAKEYFSAPFISFMSQHGILHQSSCAHTPQQNGVVERKKRHLIETARTLLLHYHVPFRFWGDAVLIACYLINRMPSSVLHAQIPHSLLFPDQRLYFLPPRVFGCTCFIHILTP